MLDRRMNRKPLMLLTYQGGGQKLFNPLPIYRGAIKNCFSKSS